jgi:NAD(P)H-hydrate epimerase
MIEVLSKENMKISDKIKCDEVTSKKLMYDAGLSIYNSFKWYGKVLIICGSGNNAGDGYVLAGLLQKNNIDVTLFLTTDKYSNAAKYYFDMLNDIKIIREIDSLDYDIIVDAIFGIGFKGDLDNYYSDIITKVNNSNAFKIAIDINSGLDSNTGLTKLAFKSDLTLAIGKYKLGHFLNMAKDYIKDKKVLDININAKDTPYYLIEKEDIKNILKDRLNYSNKGNFGYIALIGGSINYSGAIRLANMASAAMKSGAGVTKLCVPKSLGNLIIPNILESTLYPLSDKDGNIMFNEDEIKGLLSSKVIVFGMGIGSTNEVKKTLEYLLVNYDKVLVIDADGLNQLAFMERSILKNTKAKIILTPHLKEFSRLTGLSIDEINNDAINLAIKFAKDNNLILLLKGTTTIVTDGDTVYLVDKGAPGMATAGSGDVLSGIIGGILPSNLDNLLLATAGASYINGYAGEIADRLNGSISMVASDTVNAIKDAILDIKK